MIRAVLLAAAVCMDTFFAAIGCSMSRIAIPKRCALLVSVIGTAMLAVSIGCAGQIGAHLPPPLCKIGGAVLLCTIGAVQITKSLMKAAIRRRRPHIRRHALGLVIDICFDETLADADGSKTLSLREAAAFAAALSLDSLASGIGAGIEGRAVPLCLAITLVLGYVLMMAGCRIGARRRARPHAEWLGGVLLLVLGLCRLTAA